MSSLKNNWQIIFLVVAIFGLVFSMHNDGYNTLLGREKFKLQQANSDAEKEQGLSGRDFLRKNEGMIFNNSSDGDMCMWMKDMKFDLSIIWVYGGQVTYLEPDVAPNTYPKTYCHKADSVIEINVGDQQSSGLKVGDKLSL